MAAALLDPPVPIGGDASALSISYGLDRTAAAVAKSWASPDDDRARASRAVGDPATKVVR